MLRKEKSTIRTTRLQRKKECGELPDRAAITKNFSQMNPDYDPIQDRRNTLKYVFRALFVGFLSAQLMQVRFHHIHERKLL